MMQCPLDPAVETTRLLQVMADLRHPKTGCSWDQVQSYDTIAPYTVEEAYEVADAIAQRDMGALPDELGDLLFQVIYHSRIAEEAGAFTFADVARSITDKMVRRHPHVFPPQDPVAAPSGWEAHKQAERSARQQTGSLAGLPANLPALTFAVKLTRRAARVGFDWPDAAAVLDKVAEEAAELRAELPGADPVRLADEMGDLLFVLANLARKLDLDPEACLRDANAKFTRRFTAIERNLAQDGLMPADMTLAQLEEQWEAVKQSERG